MPVVEAGTGGQRMQKALTRMNVQIADAIGDLSGVTGRAIRKAMLAGERDPGKLAELRDRRIRPSPETAAKSWEGHGREDQLFILKQEMEAYEKRPQQIAGCGRKLEEHLRKLESQGRPAQPGGEAGPREAREAAAASQPDPSRKRRKPTGNQPAFDLAGRIARIAGVDLTRIDGLQAMTAQTVIGEAGVDMTGWVTEAHFASWLGLCPNNQTSGGKVLNRKSRKVVSRPAKAFRMAATSLPRSQSYLGQPMPEVAGPPGALPRPSPLWLTSWHD
ncbi:MAG: transposase [Gammaproteobacteria bacterium]